MDKDTPKSQSALREEAILQYWKENDIFNKSLEKEAPKGEYVFYDGPVTANSKPVLHTMEPFSFKDIIPRYKTMCGYHVRRKGGWDTHGLPVELQVEKKLGLISKKAIEDYGIAKFNKKCKESVWECIELWKTFTNRMGYWADQKNPYVTYHNDYIESVWNVIKEANKKKLLYKDYKVVPWCPRCETGLSSHELAQGYQDVKDLSVYVKFKIAEASHSLISSRFTLKGSDATQKSENISPIYILAWTTTPWTLPGNVALAIGKKIDYVKIKKPARSEDHSGGDNEFLILAKARLSIIEDDYEILEEFKGSDLIGLEYEPLYPFLENEIKQNKEESTKMTNAYKIYPADFVTTDDGTGVVHTAVMYGVDDFNLGNELDLPKHHLVGLNGTFYSEMKQGDLDLSFRFVRDEDVAVDIIKDLAHRGLLFKKEKYEHSYPHCWRCKTALIYYARDSWYIKMTELRDKMVKENEGINWEPAYIKEGRFGEWLRDIKDWAISRERYWGTPLPVWSCDKCQKVEVIGSVEDLKSKTKKSRNKYFAMRHGETESNIKCEVSTTVNNDDHLTELGREQSKKSANELKNKKIDFIIASPFVRTKETAEIIAENIGIKKSDIIYDDRLHEMSVPMYEGRKWSEYHHDFSKTIKNFYKAPEGNESYEDVRRRAMSFLYDIEHNYSDKNILIITHEGPIWLMFSEVNNLKVEESISLETDKKFTYLENAKFLELPFVALPHDEEYKLDLHKPYIDEVELVCDCGGKLTRTKEVMDVWLDSGTMPFSQDHYPFENKKFVEKSYPADFISEAIDQTRGWFYTLHAVGAIMGKGKAYKNVICLGHLLDANGKKMSKSLGNVVDPWAMMDKYGVDTLRLWMYSVNQPGEPKNFDEKTVAELHSKVFNLLYNVLAFYELYRDVFLEARTYKLEPNSNVLDQWIVTLLNKLTEDVTKNLDNYKLLEPVRAIRDFIDDLSTWYLRRSRERIKNGDKDAKKTLYFVLKTLIKLMAPFTPFAGEDIWQKLKTPEDKESVHLVEWPKKGEINLKILEEMKVTRNIVTLGLQARQKEGIPVRQPLKELRINNYELREEYFEIIKEELNVKEIKEYVANFKPLKLILTAPSIKAEHLINEKNIELDTHITEELKKEGQYRELVRAIQDIRKKNGLNPNDIITLIIDTNVDGQEFINIWKAVLMKAVIAKEIQIKEIEGEAKSNEIGSPDASEEAFRKVKIDEFVFKIIIEK